MVIEKDYKSVLDFLYSQLPAYQQKGPSAFKPGLDNIRELCWKMGLPQWKFKSIHVGGTNGKGSVSSMTASILQAAGFKVGLFTSPHLKSFTERIRINGKAIKEKDVVNFVHSNQGLIEKIKPSFFEMTTAMAFDYFAAKEVDIAVIEVGLGGRLDSTNILTPELSIITNVSYDHQAILGESLSEIAAEKAGIIKKLTPVIIGEMHAETKSIFEEKANELKAPIQFAEGLIKIDKVEDNSGTNYIMVTSEELFPKATKLQLELQGAYQLKNVKTVLAGLEALVADGWEIAPGAVKKGLKQVTKASGLRGRMEIVEKNPTLIFETAHNEAGIQHALEHIKSLGHQKLHIVFGVVQDKNIAAMLKKLPKEASYYFVAANMDRALDAQKLCNQALEQGLNGKAYSSVSDGLEAAKEAASEKDVILVTGSIFVIAELI